MGKRSQRLDGRAEPVGLFRNVNDRIGALAEEETAVFICECSYECFGTLELTVAEYNRIRSNPTWVLLAPDHELTEEQRVIQDSSRFLVVERLLERKPA